MESAWFSLNQKDFNRIAKICCYSTRILWKRQCGWLNLYDVNLIETISMKSSRSLWNPLDVNGICRNLTEYIRFLWNLQYLNGILIISVQSETLTILLQKAKTTFHLRMHDGVSLLFHKWWASWNVSHTRKRFSGQVPPPRRSQYKCLNRRFTLLSSYASSLSQSWTKYKLWLSQAALRGWYCH